jgi:hypothetical protein
VYRWLLAKVSPERDSRAQTAANLADILRQGVKSWKSESNATRYRGTPYFIGGHWGSRTVTTRNDCKLIIANCQISIAILQFAMNRSDALEFKIGQ